MLNNSKKDIELFYNSEMWNPTDDNFSDGLNDFFWPHNITYYSQLLPIFTYEFDNPMLLNSFDHVLLRDGKVGLTHFFLRYPEPNQTTVKLVIHSSFEKYVPLAWRAQVYLYQTGSSRCLSSVEKSLYIFVNLQDLEYSSSIELFNTTLKENKKRLKHIREINLIVGDYTIEGSFKTLSKREKVLDISSSIIKNFPNTLCKSYSLEDIQKVNLKDSAFYNFNPYYHYVSDSYVEHLFYHRGGISITNKNQKPKGQEVSLSPNHFMSITAHSSSEIANLPSTASLLQKNRKDYDQYALSFMKNNLIPNFFSETE